MKWRLVSSSVFVLVPFVVGCVTEVGLTPDLGAATIPVCVAADSDAEQDVSFTADIAPLLSNRCVPCHDPNSSSPLGFDETGFSITSYAELRRGGESSGLDIVVEGDPCASILVQKVGTAPPFGSRMPLRRTPLSLTERQTISDWIAEGALAN